MAKEVITATVEKDTVTAVLSISKNQKRSFSNMVDILLSEGVKVFKSKKSGK